MSSELFYAFVVVCWLLVGDNFRKIKTRSLMSLSIIKDLPKKKKKPVFSIRALLIAEFWRKAWMCSKDTDKFSITSSFHFALLLVL